jgi:phenylacetate-coenzyme A ligase PaaK-like adenylate-forming protein
MITFTVPENTFGRDYQSLIRRLDTIRAMLETEYEEEKQNEEERKKLIKQTQEKMKKRKVKKGVVQAEITLED